MIYEPINTGKTILTKPTNIELGIIVPCYNESGNIASIVAAFEKVIAQNRQVVVVLVNNGSIDDSQTVMEKETEKSIYKDHFIIEKVAVNKGYGYGIVQGLKKVHTPILCWTHADMQTPPEDVLRALNVYKNEKNEMVVVKGVRKNRNLLNAFFTLGMQIYTNITLKTSLQDINAQPKLFSRQFYEMVADNAPHDFSLDLYWLYKAKKIGSIKTIDVIFGKRQSGESKGGGTLKGKWKLIKRTFKYIKELKASLHA